METTIKKPARSVELTNDEVKALKNFVKKFPTQTEASLTIGIDRVVLNRIIIYKSGSEKYVNKIREFLQSLAA